MPELIPADPGTPKHDPAVCRYPVLSALCLACARLWAEEIREEAKSA